MIRLMPPLRLVTPDPRAERPPQTLEALRSALGKRFPGVVAGPEVLRPTVDVSPAPSSRLFRDGAITELLGQPGDGATTRALEGLARLLESRPKRYALWLDLEGSFYPPAAAQLGVPLTRLLLLRTADLVTGLAAVELALRGGAVCAAAVDVPPSVPPLRLSLYHRLRRRVRESGAVLLFLGRESVVPADHRLLLGEARVSSAPGAPLR